MANSQQNACCHQLAESWDKIVRVIAKQPWLDIFPELSRAGKILALVQDKGRTSSGKTMVDSQKKRVRHQLAATWDKIVRVIAKQSLFYCFLKLTGADKILELV